MFELVTGWGVGSKEVDITDRKTGRSNTRDLPWKHTGDLSRQTKQN